jgi:hypothetical protein
MIRSIQWENFGIVCVTSPNHVFQDKENQATLDHPNRGKINVQFYYVNKLVTK